MIPSNSFLFDEPAAWALCFVVFARLQSQSFYEGIWFTNESIMCWSSKEKHGIAGSRVGLISWHLIPTASLLSSFPLSLIPPIADQWSYPSILAVVFFCPIIRNICFSNCPGDEHDPVKLQEIIFNTNSVWGLLLLFWPKKGLAYGNLVTLSHIYQLSS